MTAPIIQAQGLTKTYDTGKGETVQALRGVDLTVNQGQIYALLGPNGAGKTTAISILTTLLLPTTGQAQVAGYDVVTQAAEVRRRIGVTFQETVLDLDLTGRHVLDFHGQLYGLSRGERQTRIQRLAGLVELEEALDRKCQGYSGGMKRRLELARGLLTDPRILFLDEPTQGLDPQNRSNIWRYIRRLRDEEGITILLTTHYMEEAESLADQVGIIDHGQLVVEGSPQELVRHMGADVISITGEGTPDAFLSALEGKAYVTSVANHALDPLSLLQVGVDAGDRRLAQLAGLASEVGFQIQSITVARPSLGDVFLTYTGHALRD